MVSRPSRSPIDLSAGAAALVMRLGLAFLLIGAPLASVATRQAVYVIVPVGTALTLVAWLIDPDMKGVQLLRRSLLSRAGLGALFLIAWTALSLTWTPFSTGPSERFVKTLTTVGLVALAVAFMTERTRTSNLYLLPIGAAVGAVTMIGAALAGWNPRTPAGEYSVLDRAALGLMLLFWPAVAGLLVREKPRWAVILGVLTTGAVLATGTKLALAALAASGLTFVAAQFWRRRVTRGLGWAWAALIVLSPLAALVLTKTLPARVLFSWGMPILAWGDIVAKDGMRGLVGHGFDSAARAVTAGYLSPATPRSFLFESWFELGAVGAIAAAFIVRRVFLLAGSAPDLIAPALVAGLMAALIASGFGLGLAPIWWVTFLALDAFAFAMVLRAHAKARRPASPERPAPAKVRPKAPRPVDNSPPA